MIKCCSLYIILVVTIFLVGCSVPISGVKVRNDSTYNIKEINIVDMPKGVHQQDNSNSINWGHNLINQTPLPYKHSRSVNIPYLSHFENTRNVCIRVLNDKPGSKYTKFCFAAQKKKWYTISYNNYVLSIDGVE